MNKFNKARTISAPFTADGRDALPPEELVQAASEQFPLHVPDAYCGSRTSEVERYHLQLMLTQEVVDIREQSPLPAHVKASE